MVVEIKNKDIEEFLSSFNYKEIIEFVESALRDKMLISDTKKAIKEVKGGVLIEESEFFKRVESES